MAQSAQPGDTPSVLITGSSSGIGRALAERFAARGWRVFASMRNPERGADLRARAGERGWRLTTPALDVTSDDGVAAATTDVLRETGGRLDVLVNNAGYYQYGALEETSPEELRAQLETNVVGVLRTTRAFLPAMRARRGGTIVTLGSVSGRVAIPIGGPYHASKWALEGMTESLVQEVAPFGIKVTIIEPGGFRTDWSGSSMQHSTHLSEYEFLPGRAAGAPRRQSAGDPVKAAAALLTIVDDPDPPSRVLMGVMAFDLVQEAYHRRLAEWDRSKVLARSTEWTED